VSAIVLIDPRKVKIVGRLRDVDEAEVEKIALSMSEVGQITPIEVRYFPDAEGFYVLISGAHRVAAALRNGDETIQALLFEGNSDEERLREIDENLYRHELTPYDQANFLFERREIWERLHGNLKRGGDKRSKRQAGTLIQPNEISGFYKNLGDLFSIPKRTVHRALERKRCIEPSVWNALRGTQEAKNGAFLDKLADIEPSEQKKLIEFCRNTGSTIAHAISDLRVRGTKRTPTVTLMVKKVQAAWDGWGADERTVFLREVRKLK
jgi:ParB family chromosome partitioning protein